MSQFTVAEAASRFPELIEQVKRGHEIVIAEGERPVAKLVAVPPEPTRQPRPFGSAKGLIEMSDDFDAPLEDFAEYM